MTDANTPRTAARDRLLEWAHTHAMLRDFGGIPSDILTVLAAASAPTPAEPLRCDYVCWFEKGHSGPHLMTGDDPTAIPPAAELHGRVTTCAEHGSAAEIWPDGSMGCLHCCQVETSCDCTEAANTPRTLAELQRLAVPLDAVVVTRLAYEQLRTGLVAAPRTIRCSEIVEHRDHGFWWIQDGEVRTAHCPGLTKEAAAPTPAADAMVSHAFGICAVCGASVDDPEAREYCEARDEAEKARGGCYGPRPALAAAPTPAEPLDVGRLAATLHRLGLLYNPVMDSHRHEDFATCLDHDARIEDAYDFATEYAALAASPSPEPRKSTS